MTTTKAYAAFSPTAPIGPHTFERRAPRATDVSIDILYAGICHSDLHTVRGEWGPITYPLVPGHEVVGRVSSVGAKVSHVKAGDIVGVGCFVDSCRTCAACKKDLEQYCDTGVTQTYNSPERHGSGITQGGYADKIVVDEHFVLRVSHKDNLDGVAPLLCAGITTYSPLREWKVGKGHRLAILGLGGLGHMGVKLGRALGAEVTLLSSSPSKKADAARLGAHDFVVTSDAAAMAKAANRFDFILNTISAPHDLAPYVNLLGLDGTMILLGAPPAPAQLSAFALIGHRRRVAGSLVGGVAETQEMLDFCAKHEIVADVETIAAKDINTAYERLLKSDVRYRFVIDAKTFG